MEQARLLIVAENYQQAMRYARQKNLRPDIWFYADDPHGLQGYEDVATILVGTCFRRKDWSEMKAMIRNLRFRVFDEDGNQLEP